MEWYNVSPSDGGSGGRPAEREGSQPREGKLMRDVEAGQGGQRQDGELMVRCAGGWTVIMLGQWTDVLHRLLQ